MKLLRDATLVATAGLLVLSGASASDRVRIAGGVIEGAGQSSTGVRSFKGIPFAAPPVGNLRWKPPQPVKSWTGVRPATQFGPRCMQRTSPTSDMLFRSNGMSEDCLYLNVWTPAKSARERLPVLVYIFGGGFQGGDGSEPRYDGESMARKGIVVVTLNYRTNIFGFFSHPDLTRESPQRASGNYGLLDQVAALRWVQRNIEAFGGSPLRVTIAGESAGSMSVSALMASPVAKYLFSGAIGESGALITTLPPHPLAESEADGQKFATALGNKSLADLRAMPGEAVEEAGAAGGPLRFSANIDGYFLRKSLSDTFSAGEQARVPLLAGSNSLEQPARSVMGADEPTPQNFAARVQALFQNGAADVTKAYGGSTPEEVMQGATDLAGDRFTGHSTWKWTELHLKTGGRRVYRYYYSRVRPRYLAQQAAGPTNGGRNGHVPEVRGAAHSAEIQYCLGNLGLDKRYAWEPADYKVSETMQSYFVNFIKTGDPNGAGLPKWPAYESAGGFQRMRLDVDSHAEPEPHRERYLLLDRVLQ